MRAPRPAAGQALVELAVFGAVALAALGLLIRLGMKMNFDQEIRMGAFRGALAAAAADNGTPKDSVGTLYHFIADRQMPNPTDGFMTLPRTRTEASGFVEWGDRLTMAYDLGPLFPDDGRNTQLRYIIRSNGTEREFRAEDFPRDQTFRFGPITVPRNAFRSLISQSSTTNTSSGSINESGGVTSLSSGTTTCSNTVVNTLAGDSVGSCVSSGAGVSW